LFEKTYKVDFFDANGAYLGHKRVRHGRNAQSPIPPKPPKGYRFDHWEPQVAYVLADTRTTAVYAKKEYLVTFLSETGAVLKQDYVEHGCDAEPPYYYSKQRCQTPTWNGRLTNIQRATVFCAIFDAAIA
jgi:hypothetical protein